MLELYHIAGSSNSQRVRIVLAEKAVPWSEHQLTQSADLHTQEFRAISPAGTVPALVHGNRCLTDSVVINEYLEDIFPEHSLRPADPFAAARMRQWTKHADDFLQRSIAVFTHALVRRHVVLAEHEGDVDAALAQITDPIILEWRRSVYVDGLASPHVGAAMHLILASLAKLDGALQQEEWLVDSRFTLAEAALLPAIYRLECLNMDLLWVERYPAVQAWLERGRRRASFRAAIQAYLPSATLEAYRAAGRRARGELAQLARDAVKGA